MPRELRVRLLVAGALYIGGALGLEMIEAAVASAGRETLLYFALAIVEETAEMTGAGLALCTSVRYLTQLGVHVRLAAGPQVTADRPSHRRFDPVVAGVGENTSDSEP